MNIIKRLSCLFAVMMASLLILTACNEDVGDPSSVVEIPETYKTLSFPKEGGEQIALIQSNVDLTYSSSETWITTEIEESTSPKIRKVKISCEVNGTSSERTATITVTAPDFSGTISVVQASGDVLTLLSQGMEQISTDAAGGNYEIKVSASGEPKFESTETWVTSDGPISNEDNTYTFSIKVAVNHASQIRESSFVISMGIASITVAVKQAAGNGATFEDVSINLTAREVASKMYMGWNLGNALESTSTPESWSPKATEALIDAVKNAGFNAIRIPCAWDGIGKIDKTNNYKIDADWLARVKEVVTWCTERQMFAIINTHWDGGWLEENPLYTKQSSINAELKAIWKQLAEEFKDFDGHLLFAGTNEVHVSNIYNDNLVTAENHEVQQSFNQTFVSAVREVEGSGAHRCLIVQSYNTQINFADTKLKNNMPTDVVDNKLLVEVHFYDPYDFTINSAGTCFWGAEYKSAGFTTDTWGQEAWVDDRFALMKKDFVDNGIPVIIGEFSAQRKVYAANQSACNASRAYYHKYVVKKAKENGIVPFYWDNGGCTNGNSGIFDRSSCKIFDQQAVDALLEGAAEGKYPY